MTLSSDAGRASVCESLRGSEGGAGEIVGWCLWEQFTASADAGVNPRSSHIHAHKHAHIYARTHTHTYVYI